MVQTCEMQVEQCGLLDMACNYNVYIGGETGIFKGISVTAKGVKSKNLISLSSLKSRNEITVMSWGKDECEILLGYGNQEVKVFNTSTQAFTVETKMDCGKGKIRGLSSHNGALLTGSESGTVKVWGEMGRGGAETTLECGENMERLRHAPYDSNLIATGGKENDLKIWDLQKGKITFAAKNVRPDELELRMPVWVSDMVFMPESKQVAVATRYGEVRLYDPSSNARRPVINLRIDDQSLTCIAVASKSQHVLVGSGVGQMNLVDLRFTGRILNKYKGFTGGIRQIACPIALSQPFVLSVGLDRHLRIHHRDSKSLLVKEYMQSRLSCLLVGSNFNWSEDNEASEDVLCNEESMTGNLEKNSKNEDTCEVSEEEYEALFDQMETVGEKRKTGKLPKDEKCEKKQKIKS